MNSVSHIILATLLSTGTAVAQETIDFDRHDTDNDGFLTEQEWTDIEAAETDFATLDVDQDGMLSEAEVMATQDVELEAEPATGADLDRREVAAEDHALAQRGRIDRNTEEEDPTLRGAATADDDEAAIVATDDTEAERETGEEQAAVDVATAEDDQAGFVTAENTEDNTDGTQATADEQGRTDAAARDDAGDEDEQAGFATAEDTEDNAEEMQAAADEGNATDAAGTDIEPRGGLDVQPGDVAAEDTAEVVEQPDVEIQNVDTARTRDDADVAGSSVGDDAPEMQGMGERPDPMQNGLAALGEESLQAFEEADANDDELISKEEAKEAGFEYVAIHFDTLDENNNDYLDPQEWSPAEQQEAAAAPGVRDAGATDEPLFEEPEEAGMTEGDPANTFEADFDTYDTNKDGYIDGDEADAALLDGDLFERMDIDDDGRVDSEEAGTGLEIGNDEEDDAGMTGEDA